MATEQEMDFVVKMFPDLVETMKDIASYLEKQDAEFSQASLPKGQKITETQPPISGGKDSGTGPAPNPIAKAEDMKDKEEDKEEDEETSEESTEESSEDVEELKSILKDISLALKAQQEQIPQLIKAELSKSLKPAVKEEADKMLRKMGFIPTRPDVVRLGLDTTSEVKKSDQIVKSADGKGEISEEAKALEDVQKAVTDMSKLPWGVLGQMREKEGLFQPFGR
jgi:hypothetical protein